MASKTLEKVYFHISNGGLTLEIFTDSEGELFLRSSVSNHGIKASGVTPLSTPKVVSWLQEALSRATQNHTEDIFLNIGGGEVSFRDGAPTNYGYTPFRESLYSQLEGTFVRDPHKDEPQMSGGVGK